MSEKIGLFVLLCVAYEIATGCRKIVMKYEFGNTCLEKTKNLSLYADYTRAERLFYFES